MSKYIDVEIKVNKLSGSYKIEVLNHGNGSACSDGIDESILDELLEAEVEGFGNLATEEDSGRTCEFFDEKKDLPGKKFQYKEKPLTSENSTKKPKFGLKS